MLDQAGWLDGVAFRALDAKLEAFEKETSSQFLVAVIRRLPEGGDYTDYSQRVFEKWKPGLAGKDNAAILFVFAENRYARIHTGYGMEGVLPDARCKQIVENELVPRLRTGDRTGGINAALDAMIASSKGEYTGTGKTFAEGKGKPTNPPLIIIIVIIVLVIYTKLRGTLPEVVYSGGRRMDGGSWTSGSGGGGWSSGGGGGGFSGGGGSSGGGGAGGSW